MAILLLRQFGCEMPIPAHFVEVFWGFDPLNEVRYCQDPKRHTLGRKHAFWIIDRPDRSRNATWVRAEESKKRKTKETKL